MVHRNDEPGTTENFQEHLAKVFGEYVISEDGQQTAADGSGPMSESLRTSAQEALDQITVAG